MALFHLSVTQTKRSAGQSAIASAAYRAGEFFQAEDGIRDDLVTGVQTCALPISKRT